ncbi:myelin basic protein-like [Astyanax mexicanus]|uniref:Myelin basic protein n=1 Tax=Astyanax mexicanus TaxID=7994 RepID=A0A8B9GNC3_ASTMX|nr:myelin basic protein-like [Astyanax mexicanus]
MGQHLGKREPLPETKALSDSRPTTEAEPQDDVFGLNEPDVNQNKECSGKSAGTTSSPTPEQANQSDPGAAGLRPHLVRLFSRDAPGREDNTFKERPSESDELHTIPEAGAELDDLLENEDEDAEKTS